MPPTDLPSKSRKFLGLEITVRGTSPETDLDTPLWAFNRTHLRSEWLYDLYAQGALGLAHDAGARVHFLGVAERQLASDPKLDRNELLLTYYPSAASFLGLLTNLKFEALNLTIGSVAVSERQLGFAERIDDGPPPPEEIGEYAGHEAYLGHFYRSDPQPLPAFRQRLSQAAAALGAGVYFMGVRKAAVIVGKDELPSPADGGLVFSASDAAVLERLVARPAYREFLDRTEGDSIALYRRER